LSRREASGASGTVNGQALATLVREGRVDVADVGTPRVTINGNRATASISATVLVRSSFGASRRVPSRFAFELRREGSRWVVTSGRVEG
jgi:hypothetical protein